MKFKQIAYKNIIKMGLKVRTNSKYKIRLKIKTNKMRKIVVKLRNNQSPFKNKRI
jgi:hypothetical protein